MVRVKVSKYCEGVTGADDCFEIGDKALLKASRPENKDCQVIIDSELMVHADAPKDGKVYEVIFCDGSGRWAVSAHQLYPIIKAAQYSVQQTVTTQAGVTPPPAPAPAHDHTESS